MGFAETLNGVLDALGCTTGQLAEASGLSAGTISRYRSGERTPASDGEAITKLAEGLAALSGMVDGATSLDAGDLRKRFTQSISGIAIEYDAFLGNLAQLVEVLGIGNVELARALSFDPSYISRIMSGSRQPADLPSFIAQVAGLAARRGSSPNSQASLAAMLGCDPGGLGDERGRTQAIATWLGSNSTPAPSPVESFLAKLDEFDLDEFINAIHFDEMKVPTAPFQLPTTKTYHGIAEMMEAEIDFLKAAVLSKSMEDVTMYSDMPLDEMSADPEFPKKWMLGMAMLLRKGLHLNMIHDTHRPMREMMLGLEGWIPMYMTGQISPYYLSAPQGGTFLHLFKAAGTVALAGEAVAGHQGEGRYTLYKQRDDVAYMRQRGKRMLEAARPLMRIYRSEQRAEFDAYLDAAAGMPGTRRLMLSAPPLATIPEPLIEAMLLRHGAGDGTVRDVIAYAQRERERFDAMLANGTLVLEIPDLTAGQPEQPGAVLALAGMFGDNDLRYSPDDYRAHLEATRAFADANEQCTLTVLEQSVFRNIQIFVHEKRFALVSKANAPAIHFVIEHPNMVAAFESFVPPLVD